MGKQWQTLFFGAPKSLQMVTAAMKLKMLTPWKESMTNLDSILKSRDITLPTKVHLIKAMVFPVVMYGCELDHKESWALKNWCLWTMVLEKTFESPLDCKQIQPVHPKGNQSWIFTGRTDFEAETPILHLMWRADSFEKTQMLGKITGGRIGMTEDEMVGWYHWLNGHEFELTLGGGDRQGGLACCSPWDHKESDTTKWLNWTDCPQTS